MVAEAREETGIDAVSKSDGTATEAAPGGGAGVAEASTEDTDTDGVDTVSTGSECSTAARVRDELEADAVCRREDAL